MRSGEVSQMHMKGRIWESGMRATRPVLQFLQR